MTPGLLLVFIGTIISLLAPAGDGRVQLFGAVVGVVGAITLIVHSHGTHRRE